MTRDLFVTGTDTGVGKTVLSALLVASLKRRYWKPIQTGASEGTDRAAVVDWAGVSIEETHAEAFVFDAPVSPHLAAQLQGTRIDLAAIRRPEDSDAIVIEGAGGVLVPINEDSMMIDLIRCLHSEVVIAARTTLGTINHTLLTIEAARSAICSFLEWSWLEKTIPRTGRRSSDTDKSLLSEMIPWLESINRASLIRVFDQHFDKTAFA